MQMNQSGISFNSMGAMGGASASASWANELKRQSGDIALVNDDEFLVDDPNIKETAQLTSTVWTNEIRS